MRYCGHHSEIEFNEHLNYSDTVLTEEEVPEELKKKKGIKIFSVIYMSVIYIFLIVIIYILLIHPYLNVCYESKDIKINKNIKILLEK